MDNMGKLRRGGFGVYMQLCLDLAQRAKGHTAPNPMVGAILVHNDRIIGEGWHHYYGADHAEVNCLRNVAEADKHLIPESTMYVNLEPCAHYGITPPCANRLVEEKVKKVVIANTDPFEKVSGKGIDILKKGGIEVETGVLEKEGLWVNRRFFCFHTQKRPYIILKWAQTKDGFIAPADRSRLQITGDESTRLVHKWRTEEAAIMVGTTTAMNDNPQLTARLWQGKQPLRIVLDRKLQLPHAHHVFDKAAATWIINEQKELLEGNIHSIPLIFDDTLLQQLLHKLYETKILSLVVEGGATLLNNFINAGLWDEARVFTGTASLKDGIPAPVLRDEVTAYNTAIGNDTLQVSVNKNSAYAYVKGMEL
jgi:diaminohydroxyphosphoribosylaminopyrimidine deaminase/5-amino-6-(5-phosphoribosylamino)uracil reductase